MCFRGVDKKVKKENTCSCVEAKVWDLSAMPHQRFVILCAFGCHNFTLRKEDSEEDAKEFPSIMDAMSFLRFQHPTEATRVAVLNPFGEVMMETVI